MRAEDSAGVAELTSQLGYPASEGDIRRRHGFISRRDDGRILVAADGNGSVIGWIHVQATYMLEADTRAEIWGLVVAESSRGSGVGGALVREAESWAIARGLPMVAVRSNALRVDARRFYERLGYTVVKTQNSFRKALVNPGHARLG